MDFGLGTILIRILARNARVKALLDRAVTDFVDGFTRKPPTREQRIEALRMLIEEVKKPAFADAFSVREDYFEFLLATITEVAYVKEQPFMVEDFYVPGYCLYFPRPQGAPVTGSPERSSARTEPGSERLIQAPLGSPYVFYAVPIRGNEADTLEKLARNTIQDPPQSDINAWRDALASRVSLDPDEIVAIKGLGRSSDADCHILIAAQDPFGTSDLQMQPRPHARATIVKALEEMLNRSMY